ncbi:pseudouridine synthase [Rhizobiaceae bacterium BDR2-2]|uniref:Pseudouridine synthase n=1 Tax=Ectorhizobium quercum TaxID=2965071 RepID=A0AAE3MYA8_9HYPH|nr:pseudouridine synthase [Ectorhizobium quercum]MCX8996299.1 pseudouridine synthase [Ectorhizobium quercum]MCX8998662.1 pseudouridine synthase [Ectorhizobium quercum]
MSFNDKSGKPGGKRPGGNKAFKGGGRASGGKFAGGGAGRDGKDRFADKPARDKAPARAQDKAPAKAIAAKAAKPVREKAVEAAPGEPERISKLLARAGVASRRDVERMIMEGRVSVNGKVLDTPVVNATFDDTIEVDGKAIRGPERTRLWLYHKPSGLVTTNSDPEGRPTVFENLPPELPRVLSVGRLDINTEGLLLLTNDGGLARTLELPKNGWLRRYRVRAHGKVEQAQLDALKEGVAVNGVLYGGIEATLDRVQGGNVWITMAFREGKNREVKNVLGSFGLEVNRLIRLSYGPFQLGDLPEGAVVEVRGRTLRDQLGPRLIEESGANFDAPIFTVSIDDDEDGEAPAAPARRADRPDAKAGPRKEGRPFEKDRGGKGRDDRGADRPARGFDKPRRDFDDDGERPKRAKPGSSRTANIWMAPGARPVGPKQAARPGKSRPEAAPYRPVSDKPSVASTIRRSGEENEWISASEAPAGRGRDDDRPSGRKDAGGKRGFAGKPARPAGEGRPERGERGEKPFADKPRGAKSFGGKPRGDGGGKPFGGKPRGAGGSKPFAGKGGKPGGRGRKG